MNHELFSSRSFFSAAVLVCLLISGMSFQEAPDSFEYTAYAGIAVLSVLVLVLIQKKHWNTHVPLEIWFLWATASRLLQRQLPFFLTFEFIDIDDVLFTFITGLTLYLFVKHVQR